MKCACKKAVQGFFLIHCLWPQCWSSRCTTFQLHGVLGYNDVSLIQSATEDAEHLKELKAEHFHSISKTIVATLIIAQQAGALNVMPSQFEEETKMVTFFKVPTLNNIGDTQGGNKICCSTTCCYLNKLEWLCHKWNVHGDDLVQCIRISMVKIIVLVQEDNQQDIHYKFN